MRRHHWVTRLRDCQFRGWWVSPQAKPPAPKPTEDLPQVVRRLVACGWDYDHIRRQVERQFPPTAPTRHHQRERIARLIARYRHGNPALPALPQ